MVSLFSQCFARRGRWASSGDTAILSSALRCAFSQTSTPRKRNALRWTPDECQRIIDLCQTQSIQHVHDLPRLFPGRAIASIFRKAAKLLRGQTPPKPGWTPEGDEIVRRGQISPKPRWTPEETEIIRRGRLEGHTWAQIAKELSPRIRSSIRRHWSRVCSTANAGHSGRWTAAETAKVLHLRDEVGLSWKEIAAKLDREATAIRYKYITTVPREFQQGTSKRLEDHKWTEEQLKRLQELKGLGWDRQRIGRALGRTDQAIANKLSDLRLVRQKRPSKSSPDR